MVESINYAGVSPPEGAQLHRWALFFLSHKLGSRRTLAVRAAKILFRSDDRQFARLDQPDEFVQFPDVIGKPDLRAFFFAMPVGYRAPPFQTVDDSN